MTEILGGTLGIVLVCIVAAFLLFLTFAWIVLPFTISKKLDRLINETIVSNRLLDDIRNGRPVVQEGIPIRE